MFILEDLHNSAQEIWAGSEDNAKKRRGGRESYWNCPCRYLKAAKSDHLEKGGHKQDQCLF